MSRERLYFYIGDKPGPGGGIEGIGDETWRSILQYGIQSATHFEARFPNDSCVGQGKEEFLRLPKISVGPWSGMAGAIAVHGEMTPEAKALFLQMVEGDAFELWDYILFRNGKELLMVSVHRPNEFGRPGSWAFFNNDAHG